MLYGNIGVTFVYYFALRKFHCRGRWSLTPKIQDLPFQTFVCSNGICAISIHYRKLQRGVIERRYFVAVKYFSQFIIQLSLNLKDRELKETLSIFNLMSPNMQDQSGGQTAVVRG